MISSLISRGQLNEAVAYGFRDRVSQKSIDELPESGTAENTRLIAIILSIKNPKDERYEKGNPKQADYKRLVLRR